MRSRPLFSTSCGRTSWGFLGLLTIAHLGLVGLGCGSLPTAFRFGGSVGGSEEHPAASNGFGAVDSIKPGITDELTLNSGARVGGNPLILRAAKNEWVDGFLTLPPASSREGWELKVTDLNLTSGDGRIEASRFRVYRVEKVPVETRSVGAVRDGGPGGVAGGDGTFEMLPRVLVPLEGDPAKGIWKIPANQKGTASGLLYIELKPAITTPSGTYTGKVELCVHGAKDGETVPVQVVVDDLVLSDVPSFSMYGEVKWEDLVRLFPREFGTPDAREPRLLTRKNARNVIATERLDQIVRLCREHRLDVGFTRLSPTVKYTPRDGLKIDWEDYDSLVMPWLMGEIDPSKEGLSAFPLPVPDEVKRGGAETAKEFYASAIGHFEQQKVLGKMLLPGGGDGVPESALGTSRLAEKIRRPGEVVSLPSQSEEGLRQVAWQAFAERRDAARAGEVSPSVASLTQGGELATRAVWFYPGEWFGVRGVVPSLGVKWARRAQQDRELMELARRRGAEVLVQNIARRITRFGEPRPRYGGELLTPIASVSSWLEGLKIIRMAAVARAPGVSTVDMGLAAEEEEAFLRWSQGLDAPLALPQSVSYRTESGEIRVRTELDLIDVGADVHILRVPDGWTQVHLTRRKDGVTIEGVLSSEGIRYPVTTAFDARGTALLPNGTLRVETVSGPERSRAERDVVVPVVAVLPSPVAPVLDGRMGDWSDEELIHMGGLVRHMDRYAVQRSTTVNSSKGTAILARWDDGKLYISVRVQGIRPEAGTSTNFASEQKGRAYGEDLCRLVVSKVGGRELRLLLKPTVVASESPGDVRELKYASSVEGDTWRAELAIPASLLGARTFKSGDAMAFNLVRYDAQTGESAAFAGPVDEDYQPLGGVLMLVNRRPTLFIRKPE